MKASGSSEILVAVYQTTQHHIWEDSNLHISVLHTVTLRSILILPHNLQPVGLLPSGIPNKILYSFMGSPVHAICLAHSTFRGLIILVMCDKVFKLVTFSLCQFLQPRYPLSLRSKYSQYAVVCDLPLKTRYQDLHHILLQENPPIRYYIWHFICSVMEALFWPFVWNFVPLILDMQHHRLWSRTLWSGIPASNPSRYIKY
jgi:hypothetical protein